MIVLHTKNRTLTMQGTIFGIPSLLKTFIRQYQRTIDHRLPPGTTYPQYRSIQEGLGAHPILNISESCNIFFLQKNIEIKYHDEKNVIPSSESSHRHDGTA